MKSKRYQAQEPQNQNKKKDQLQKSPEEKSHLINDKKDSQRPVNPQKQNHQQNSRQEKQSSKQTVRYNNYPQNPQSLYQTPQNNFGQISQQIQNPLLPLSQFQMIANPAQLLNPSPFTAPFQPPVSPNLPQINIDSQQYFQLQKQLILQQHVIQMQAQVAQLAQQQQKFTQRSTYDQQQMINPQQIFDFGYNGTAFADPGLTQNFNHQNFQQFPADNYQQVNQNGNEEQSSDYISSQDDQRKSKAKKLGNEKYTKAQTVQNTEFSQKDQKSNLQKKKSFSKMEDDQIDTDSEDEIKDHQSPQQNGSQLLGKRSLVKKTQQQKEILLKQETQQKNKAQNKSARQKDLNFNNDSANNQKIQSDHPGFRRSLRSSNRYDPINQNSHQLNKDHSQNDSDKQKQVSPVKQSHNEKNNLKIHNNKNPSFSEKKVRSTKTTDPIVSNEYAKMFDDIKKENNKTIAEINQCKRTTRNQMKNIAGRQRLDVQNSFIELDDSGRKKCIKLQKNYDKKASNKKNNEFENLFNRGKKEAQTQIAQNKKILRNNMVTNSVQNQQNQEEYDSESKDEDFQLIAELNKEKKKAEKIQIFDDQQLKDMTVLFGMTNDQIEDIKIQQQNKLKAIQERSILFGEQVNINQQQEIIDQNKCSQQIIPENDKQIQETLQNFSQNISQQANNLKCQSQISDNKPLENVNFTQQNINDLDDEDQIPIENQQLNINTSLHHENMQNKLKVQQYEFENLQKQIEQIQETLKLNGNQILIESPSQIDLNQEKVLLEDFEMKVELSQEDLSDQTESICETQVNQPIQNHNVQINDDVERQNMNQLQDSDLQIIEQNPKMLESQNRELANTLRLPLVFENLISFQKQIDISLNLLYSRSQQSTLNNLKEMIEKSCHKQFTLKSFRQIIFIAPQMYSHQWEMKQGKMELIINATTQFEDLSSKKYIEKIAFSQLKTSHIMNRETGFKQLIFKHLLNDFQSFIKKNERFQTFNLYSEKKWPLEFELDNENIVPQIPFGAIKDQPEMQQKSSLKDFIHENDSKSKILQNFSQIKSIEVKEDQEIVKKVKKNNYSDYNTSESESEEKDPQVNIQKLTGLTAETLNNIQLRQKLEEQEKQNQKELYKIKESKANAETLVLVSDQIWSIAQQSQVSVIHLNKVFEKIIDNKRGFFWSRETLFEKIKLLAQICSDLYNLQQQPGMGYTIRVNKNLNLQSYNVHRKINDYIFSDNKQNLNKQIQDSKQINTQKLSQDNQKMHEQNRSISSDRNNQYRYSQNQENSLNQGNSAFSKFNRSGSQNQQNNIKNEVQSFDKILQEEKVKELNYQNLYDTKHQNQRQVHSNNERQLRIKSQAENCKSQAENCNNVSSVETFMTGEECQSNKSIDAEAQQKQIAQLQRGNQFAPRDQTYQNNLSGAFKNISKDTAFQQKDTQVRNRYSDERIMSNVQKQGQNLNMVNKKSNIPEIMEKVYQPTHQNENLYQKGNMRAFENQKYYQGVNVFQRQSVVDQQQNFGKMEQEDSCMEDEE